MGLDKSCRALLSFIIFVTESKKGPVYCLNERRIRMVYDEIRVRRSLYFGIVMESDKGELHDYIRDHFEISPVKLKI